MGIAYLRVCERCWDQRNSLADQHRCWAALIETISCDCPCREERHSDLNTIDLGHDRGIRDLASPFGDDGSA
jgi:hypothetical protein